MATFDTLTVTYDRKVQLDQFEPVSFGATAEISLESEDSPEGVHEQMSAVLQGMVERELAARVARKKLAETGPSVPKVKAVIRDETDTLDDDDVTAIAERLVESMD